MGNKENMDLKKISDLKSIITNLENLFREYPYLKELLDKLKESGIKYGLYAGSHVSLLTSNRIPTDIDILVSSDSLVKLKNNFKIEKTTIEKVSKEILTKGKFMYLNDEKIEIVSDLVISIGLKKYLIGLTELVCDNLDFIEVSNTKVQMLPVEDTIIIKAILQRGFEYGKHDIDDIKALLNVVAINTVYLKKRLIEVKADKRVFDLLAELQIM